MSISMNFIVRFLKIDGMNTIMVIIDRFTKYVVFVDASWQCVQLRLLVGCSYQNMVKYSGVPSYIVSDHNMWFIGKFETMLFNMMGTVKAFHYQSFTNRWTDRKEKCFI